MVNLFGVTFRRRYASAEIRFYGILNAEQWAQASKLKRIGRKTNTFMKALRSNHLKNPLRKFLIENNIYW
jgi:hypothetical protein